MLTEARAVPPLPSLASYTNPSSPLKFAFGVYSKEPSEFNTRSPSEGPLTRLAEKASPSASLSFSRTPGVATLKTASSSTS